MSDTTYQDWWKERFKKYQTKTKEAIEMFKQDVDTETPVDTGELKSKNRTFQEGETIYGFVNDCEYAIYVHQIPGRKGSGYYFIIRPWVNNRQKYIDHIKGD